MEEEKKETKPVEKLEEKKATEAKKQETPKKADKKSTMTKGDNKKGNNNVIIGVIVAIIVIIAVILVMFFMKDSPKKLVEDTLKDLKTGTHSEQMLSGLLQGEDSIDAEAQKLIFEKLEWKVLKVNEEGDTATVELEITNKDFKTIMQNYMQKALKIAFSGQTITEEEMTNYLMEELKNEEVGTVTANQSIELKKQDGKWKIANEESFASAVLPGLQEAISAFN
ncbi:MAG: hypothetical protein HFJ35_02220 [Clostridia bacterium]|nr:hypothetical protein [Clostridia bacterium]